MVDWSTQILPFLGFVWTVIPPSPAGAGFPARLLHIFYVYMTMKLSLAFKEKDQGAKPLPVVHPGSFRGPPDESVRLLLVVVSHFEWVP